MGASNVIQEIRRSTRRRFSPEENIWIVFEDLRGQISVPAGQENGYFKVSNVS